MEKVMKKAMRKELNVQQLENVCDVIEMERGIETDKDEEVNGLVSDEGCEELLQCDLNEFHRIDNEKLNCFWKMGVDIA